MPANIVVGTQWGDEGKGKIIDIIASRADVVVRSQGGNNAGHTVVNDGQTYKLHLWNGAPHVLQTRLPLILSIKIDSSTTRFIT